MQLRVMNREDFCAVRSFLRAGLNQYELTPAKVPPLVKNESSAHDRLAKRLGIQTDAFPLVDAGYRSDKQITKLIENAIARPTQTRRAQLAVFALSQSMNAVRWRRVHGWQHDTWFMRLLDLQHKRVPWAETPFPPLPPRDRDAELLVLLPPGVIDQLADFSIRSLLSRGFIKAPEQAQARASLARAIDARRGEWNDGFISSFRFLEGQYDVGVIEASEMQPEGVELQTTRIVIKRKCDGAPPGRPATHHEFLNGILAHLEASSVAQKSRKR